MKYCTRCSFIHIIGLPHNWNIFFYKNQALLLQLYSFRMAAGSSSLLKITLFSCSLKSNNFSFYYSTLSDAGWGTCFTKNTMTLLMSCNTDESLRPVDEKLKQPSKKEFSTRPFKKICCTTKVAALLIFFHANNDIYIFWWVEKYADFKYRLLNESCLMRAASVSFFSDWMNKHSLNSWRHPLPSHDFF